MTHVMTRLVFPLTLIQPIHVAQIDINETQYLKKCYRFRPFDKKHFGTLVLALGPRPEETIKDVVEIQILKNVYR